jgi:hypothetical protein
MSGKKTILSARERRTERQLASEKRFEGLSALENPGCRELAAALMGEFGPEMDERFGHLIIEKGLWEEALGLAFHDDPRVAFRASWALGWAYFEDRELFRPFIARFIEDYLRAENPSVHRMYAKMLCDMIRCGLVVLDPAQAERVAEKTFDLLIGTETKSAVRVWAAEILFELSPRLEWVEEHLAAVLRQQIETMPTPAILNHHSKLLKRING